MKFIIYLINLDGSDTRLLSAQQQLQQAGLDFIRVSAVDGRNKNFDDFECVNPSRMWSYLGRELSGGEVGCYLSHVECVKRFLDTDADIGIVLEDDIRIKFPEFITILLSAVGRIQSDWHVINFGNQKNKIFTPVEKFDIHGRSYKLVKAHYFPMTTTGVCWSRQGAKAFMEVAFPVYASVDRYLRHWQTRQGRGYCFMPALVETTGAVSDISRPRKTLGLHFKDKIGYGLKKQWRMVTDKFVAYLKKYI